MLVLLCSHLWIVDGQRANSVRMGVCVGWCDVAMYHYHHQGDDWSVSTEKDSSVCSTELEESSDSGLFVAGSQEWQLSTARVDIRRFVWQQVGSHGCYSSRL